MTFDSIKQCDIVVNKLIFINFKARKKKSKTLFIFLVVWDKK